MAHRRRPERAKRIEDNHLHLSVEHVDAEVHAGISHHAHWAHLAWNIDDRDPVYEFGSSVTILAKLIYPDHRAGETFQLTFYSADAPSHNLSVTLKDIHARDKNGVPQYREYRHKQVPVYAPPKGLGLIEKIRGESRWIAWVRTSGHFLSDTLALLRLGKPLFVVMHERNEERKRWIQSVGVQTQTPSEE